MTAGKVTQESRDFFADWTDVDDQAIQKILERLSSQSAERDGKIAAELGRITARVTQLGERQGRHSLRLNGVEEEGDELKLATDTGRHRLDEHARQLALKQIEIEALKDHLDDARAAKESECAAKESETARLKEKGWRPWLIAVVVVVARLVELLEVLL